MAAQAGGTHPSGGVFGNHTDADRNIHRVIQCWFGIRSELPELLVTRRTKVGTPMEYLRKLVAAQAKDNACARRA